MKTAWVVDGAYLHHEAKSREGNGFDYLRLKSELERITGEVFYESYFVSSISDSPTRDQISFHSWLRMAAPHGPKMRVILHGLKHLHSRCPNCQHEFDRSMQKGVDVTIATLLLKLCTHSDCEKIILAAGDGDFEAAVSYIKTDLKKSIWLVGSTGSLSPNIQCYADNVIWIDEIWSAIAKPSPKEPTSLNTSEQ